MTDSGVTTPDLSTTPALSEVVDNRFQEETQALNWPVPERGQQAPFLWPLQVTASDIDHYGHVNNAVYLKWLEDTGWAHLQQLGVTLERQQAWNVAMVVYRHELDYLAPAYDGEALVMATWLESHNRLSVYRRFELKRLSDGKTLFKARSHYVATFMNNGKIRRIPSELSACYAQACPPDSAARSE